MSVKHHSIEFAGGVVGHAINLGTRYTFYTTHPGLKRFDARLFDSLECIRAAVDDRLRARQRSIMSPWRPEARLTEDEITGLMNDQIFDDDPRAKKGH